jgi:type IV secretory pathway VirB2 component (pilin)
LQPGGHRFDPGQLHQKIPWEAQVNRLIDSVFGLGALLVPISAIIVGGVIAVVGMVHRHQERLAKIERGIHPNAS